MITRTASGTARASSLAAVVVSYNSSDDLARQLSCDGVRRAFDHIVVVDNGSRDDSVSVASELGAEVHVLSDNPGFGAAVNFGVRRTASPFFAILNPDVYFDDDRVVQRLLARFSEPRVGMVGPGLVLPDGSLQDSARAVPPPWQLLARRLSGRDLGMVRSLEAREVDWLVGACMLVRRSAFDQVGGFDERYWLYFEDVDLCVRFWKRGWEIVYEPELRARHDHRAESRRTFVGKAMRQHLRSAARFYTTHPELARGGRRRRRRGGLPAMTDRGARSVEYDHDHT